MVKKWVEKTTGSFTSYDGTSIYFEVRGRGRPLILCYGIGCLMNHWKSQIEYFATHYQVITFDYRAHHQSEVPINRENLNVDSIALDLIELIRVLKLQKVSAWGHSFGAQIVTRAYDLDKDLFDNLIFINGFVTNPIRGMFGNDLATSAFDLFKSGYKVLPETLKYVWKFAVNNSISIQLSALAGGFNLQLTHLKDVEIYAKGLTAIDLDAFISIFESMMKYDGSSVLERIRIPALIIGGKQDSVTPEEHQKKMYQKIKGSELLMVPYGSHCTQLDMPDFVNLAIEKFLIDHDFNRPLQKKSKSRADAAPSENKKVPKPAH